MHNYLMSHQTLPPGTLNSTGPILSVEGGGYHMNWMVQILPFLDQPAAYNLIDFAHPVYAEANRPVRKHFVSTFICPSDPFTYGRGVNEAAMTNYCGIHNDYETQIDVKQNGVLFLNSSIRPVQILDGMSNTLFVAESRMSKSSKSELGWMSGTSASLRNPVEWTNRSTPDATPNYQWHKSPDPIQSPNDQKGIQPPEYVGGFSSSHVGGVQVLVGDGSVRFISSNINTPVLRNLCHRGDGQLIEDF
jgi:hypothetical protein